MNLALTASIFSSWRIVFWSCHCLAGASKVRSLMGVPFPRDLVDESAGWLGGSLICDGGVLEGEVRDGDSLPHDRIDEIAGGFDQSRGLIGNDGGFLSV